MAAPDMMRVAIVDAEQVDRDRIRSLLANHDDIEIVAECSSRAEALASIDVAKPHIVFVDVEAPNVDGFELVKAMESPQAELRADVMAKRPAFVFVTACSRSAVKAFEVRALDCLLKPLERARFEKTVARARALVRQSRESVNDRLIALLHDLRHESREPARANRLIVRSGGRIRFLRAQDVDWIEAAGNYVRLHSGADAHLVRASMKTLERQLDPKIFLRIHRSAIVNIDRIKGLRPWANGEYVVTMQDDTQLQAGRVYSHHLDALIESDGLGER